MNRTHRVFALGLLATMVAFTACTEDSPLAPSEDLDLQPAFSGGSGHGGQRGKLRQALKQIRRATARYHDVRKAEQDGFVLLHECEERDGEAVGVVYANFTRVLDGKIDPKSPDALIYEPGKNGKLKLVGAEFAIPYPLWTGTEAPEFFGNEFEREDEFGVFGLHVWVWRHNPNGMFAESNPRVSCN
jgi:hypothetical protein